MRSKSFLSRLVWNGTDRTQISYLLPTPPKSNTYCQSDMKRLNKILLKHSEKALVIKTADRLIQVLHLYSFIFEYLYVFVKAFMRTEKTLRIKIIIWRPICMVEGMG